MEPGPLRLCCGIPYTNMQSEGKSPPKFREIRRFSAFEAGGGGLLARRRAGLDGLWPPDLFAVQWRQSRTKVPFGIPNARQGTVRRADGERPRAIPDLRSQGRRRCAVQRPRWEDRMIEIRRRSVALALAVGAGIGMLALPPVAQADWKPQKPVEFVIMAGQGGGADRLARLIQSIIEKNDFSNQPFIPINKGGGSGARGVALHGRQGRRSACDHGHAEQPLHDTVAQPGHGRRHHHLHADRPPGRRHLRPLGQLRQPHPVGRRLRQDGQGEGPR